MPAFVKSRPGDCGINEAEGTMLCCFSRKKSRKEVRISEAVMGGAGNWRKSRELETLNFPGEVHRRDAEGAKGTQSPAKCLLYR